jgi:hypothetical protein
LILATVSALLMILAILLPAWIEEYIGREPDGGIGTLEWLLPLPFAVAVVALGGVGYRAHRQAIRSSADQ